MKAIPLGIIAIFIVSLAIVLFSENPKNLELVVAKERHVDSQPIPIEFEAQPEKTQENFAEEMSSIPLNPAEALAPQSMSSDVSQTDYGFGAAFGSGGTGPRVGSENPDSLDAINAITSTSQIDRLAKIISRSPPEFPASAKARGLRGYVTLKVKVASTGNIETVRVEQSDPAGVFDDAAMRAIKTWRFEAAILAGKPASSWVVQKIRFDLN